VVGERIMRQTRPTASFSIDVRHLVWLRTMAGVSGRSVSAILRDLLDAAMNDTRTLDTGDTAN